MILSKAPHRLSLFGGGTDVAPFCDKYGGMVINLAINIYNSVVIDPNKKGSAVDQGELVAAVLKRYGLPDDFNVDYVSVGGSGLGSSASFTVALIGAICRYLGKTINKERIAEEAFKVETKILKWHGGCQDQYACALGGFNVMEINKGSVKVIPLSDKYVSLLVPWMVLFDTNIRRKSYDIQNGFKELSRPQTKALMKMKGLCFAARRKVVHGGKNMVPLVAKLMHKTWLAKKKSNNVSNDHIDEIYIKGLKSGALGGKVMGAGQGGCILFMCPPKDQNYLIRSMQSKGLNYIPFRPDFDGLVVI